MTPETNKQHRQFEGVVTSTAMTATATVRVDRRVAHPKYGKYYTVSKKYHVDDPKKAARVGDVIAFEECRPISKTKRWRYLNTVKPAAA